jgi:HisJ family histidinol phosphate phosphatase
VTEDPRIAALPDIHGHAKGEHKPFAEERPIPYTARMLFLWFYHACRRGSPRFLMVADHMNYLTFEDPAAVNLVRRALKLAQAGDLYGAAETAGVELVHAAAVSEGLRKGIRYSIGAEVDNDPRCRPDAQNIVDAMRPDGMIRSVHFLPISHPLHGENWMWPFDNPEFADLYETVGTEQVWEIYMATLLDAIDKLPGHIVAHFYVPAKFGHWPEESVLEAYEDRLVDACAERSMAIEVNSRYLYKFYAGDEAQLERYRTAHLRLLRKAKAKGVSIAVGSDAHSPKDQGRAFDAVLALLDEAEINEIAFPINGRLARVALRATEEILRQQSAALAAPAPRAGSPLNGAAPPSDSEDDEDDDEGELIAVATPQRAEPAQAEPETAAVEVKAPKKRPPRKKTPAAAVVEVAEVVASVDHASVPEPALDESAPVELPVLEAPALEDPVVAEAVREEPIVAEALVAEAVVVDEPVAEHHVEEPPTVVPDVEEPVVDEAPATGHVVADEPVIAEVRDEPAVVVEEPEFEPEARPAEAHVPDTPVKAKPKTRPKSVLPPAAAKLPPKPPKPEAKAPVKAAAAKPPVKKTTSAKPAAKKAPAKTAAAKKSTARPAAKPAKKAAAKKAAPRPTAAKPAVAKRAVAKKSVAKKAAKKKTTRPRR